MTTTGRAFLAAILSLGAFTATPAGAGTLDDIKKNGEIRIAYRDDEPPFSYENKAGAPGGFMMDLCRSVAAKLGEQLGNAALKVSYVSVSSNDRFDAITGGKADLLCAATTHTLERRKTLAFSIPTFVDGASFMIKTDGPRDFAALAGKRVGVLANTTTETELKRALAAAKIDAEVYTTISHGEGIIGVQTGSMAAYYGDRAILTYMLTGAGARRDLLVADTYLSVEPYALAMRRGDEDFRLAVDRALSQIYRSGEIGKIFTAAFDSAKPSATLQSLFTTSALPQ
jgi:ABC-type amino acid transport substrate-binding protein